MMKIIYTYFSKEKIVLEVEWHVDLTDVDEHTSSSVDDGQLPETEGGEPLTPALLGLSNERLGVLDST